MSMPPPPGNEPPPPYQPYGQGQQPPMGYQPYGAPYGGGMQPAPPQGTNGMSIASLVLSLVNVIPCFWVFPIPAILGIIFGIVGRGQINKNPGQRGKGMAIAGLVVGIVFLVIGAIFWIYIATSDDCYRDGSTFRCYSD